MSRRRSTNTPVPHHAEQAVTPDQQTLWDIIHILGENLEGYTTPAALIADSGEAALREKALRAATQLRDEYELVQDELAILVDEANPQDRITTDQLDI